MDGYTAVTSDGEKIGTVVGDEGRNLIVETGTLRHHTHAVPKTFTHVHDAEQKVVVTVTKDVVMDSPKCDDGLDTQAIAAHYGLSGDEAEPVGIDSTR